MKSRFAHVERLRSRQALLRRRPEPWLVPAAALGLFLLVYGSWQLGVWGSWSQQTLIGDALCYPVDMAAVWAAWRASRRAAAVARVQRAWRLLSLAAFVYLLGDVIYNVYDLLGIAPYPSAADGLYLGFYPVMLMGLLSFRVRPRGRGESLRLWMDISLVALAFSAAVIYLVLGPSMHQASSSSLQSVFSVAYPVGDMVLLVGLSAALMRGSAPSTKRSLHLLAAALTFFIAADLVYGYMTTHAGYAGGDGVDTLWIVAFGLFALAGTAQRELDGTMPAETALDRVGWLPFAAVAFGFGVLLYVDRDDAFYPGVAMTLVAMTLAAILSIRLFLGQRDLLEAQEELSHRALHDNLTGLANRVLLRDRLDQTLVRGARSGSRVAVMLLDVDEFKLVNDRLGHAAGDELLVQLARRLKSVLRDGETIARLGGDEFAIIAEISRAANPVLLAERVLCVFADAFTIAGSDHRATGSLGITTGEGAVTADELLRRADAAMYRVKTAAKNGFAFYESPTVARAPEQRIDVGRPQEALRRDSLMPPSGCEPEPRSAGLPGGRGTGAGAPAGKGPAPIGPRLLATVAAGAALFISGAVIHERLGGSAFSDDYDNLAQWGAAWLAAGSCWLATRRGEPGMRRFWGFLCASAFAWGLGEGVANYYGLVLGREAPVPSPADIGFLLAVPLMIVSLLTFPLSRVRPFARAVMLLDGGLVAGSTLFVSWALVLGPIYRAHQGNVHSEIVTLAYPACDVLIVAVLLSVAARASRSGWVPLGLVAAGVLALTFSDSVFAYLTQTGSDRFGLNGDIGWIAGFLILALAPVWTGTTAVRRVSVERPSRIGMFIPYIPVTAALAVAVSYVAEDRDLGSFLVTTAVVSVIFLTSRQLAALLDTVSLGNEQAARFAALVQDSSDLTSIVTADGIVTYQSPSSLPLLGWPRDRFTGRGFDELVHPDDAHTFLISLAQVTSRPDGEVTSEWRLRHSDGHYIPTESRLANRRDDPRVGGVTINSRDISERQQLEHELRVQAVHDALTGLPNRTLLNDRLDRALALRLRDESHPGLAVLVIDLDDFTSVNEGLGHEAGDDLLREVARRLGEVVRDADTVARTGGDEFSIVLDSSLDATRIEETADRILAVFDRPFRLCGQEHFHQASVGIALSGDGSADSATLLQKADIAMHAAKVSGKGRRETYKAGMYELVAERLKLGTDMRHAVEREELAVVYQPVVELATGALDGVEALMRWRHPTRGLLAPDAFIPTAEISGQIIPMGRWLLHRACSDLRSWDDLTGVRPLRLHANLSARQLDHPGLVADVAAALTASHLDPSRLTLEITETTLLGDVDSASTILSQLRGLGIELSIDDFGTGYSSLSYLRDLAVDEIKIDRSFVAPIAASDDAANLVHTIVRLADDLHLRTVAEGVETREQLDELRTTTCELAQGYLFGPLLSREQIRAALEDGGLTWVSELNAGGGSRGSRSGSPRPSQRPVPVALHS